LQESQDIVRVTKENLQVAYNQQNMYVDKNKVHRICMQTILVEEEWCKEVEVSLLWTILVMSFPLDRDGG
jgi:hypothetical protein